MRRVVACAFMLTAAVTAPADEIEVMILGTYHLANPGQDLHNVEVDDVTAPERQRQLEALTDALVAFAPHRVAVERTSQLGDLALDSYRNFEPSVFEERRGETVQIGYRLAHRLGHEDVYGIDEQDDSIDYFPYGPVAAFAGETGREAALQDLHRQAERYVRTVGRLHADSTIAEALIWMNQPALIERQHRALYYSMLEFADAERQPGALLNGRYYLRNAHIFARLAAVARPGERILVVFGAGHAYWLRHLVTETPGWTLVEPNPYLSAAATAR